jgi:hypothetical protein
VNTITLPVPLFILFLATAAAVAGLLVATAAERLTRVRQQAAHGERHRHGQPNLHERR